jgi:hypothetical protein
MDEEKKETAAEDNHNKRVEDIIGYKNLIDNFPDNDFFLFPFMSMVLNLTDEKGFISETGMKLLHNDIQKDIDILKERGDDPSQYALCRLSLWYCLTYNILTLYCSFIASLELDEAKQYADKLPTELKEYLKVIAERGLKLIKPIEGLVKHYTNLLTDKFANIFNEEKRKCWTKDLFQTRVEIPVHPNDLPEGFDPRNIRRVGV